jgi:hypothetical protein
MFNRKLAYPINRFSTPKTSVLIIPFQEVKKYHLSKAIRCRTMRHT